jgi:LCP family protein required for cell wall assembly
MLPHAVFAYYDISQYQFLTNVFAEDDVAAPRATTTTSADGATAGASTSTAAVPEPAIWDGLDRLNILLMGGDAGPNRRAIRTDTMIVASIDPVSGDAALLSVPRNWARVPLPEGHGVWECQCFPRILNDLYYAGEVEYPDAFPGPQSPGENAIKMGMAEFLGMPIHYYALVDLTGFVGVIDALGGVEIDIPFRIVDETYPHEDGETIEFVDIQPGTQTLDGHLALAYARIRRHADDYARMNRQRCVLEAVLKQSSPTELLAAYPRLLGVLSDNLQTDIPISRLDDFIDLLPILRTDKIVALRLIPPDYRNGYNDFGFSTPDVELIQEHVRTVLENPPDVAIEMLGLDTLEDACS